MKSELIETNLERPATFPALYQSTNGQCTVLFTTKQQGTVVQTGSILWEVGDSSEGWFSCLDTAEWTRLPSGSQVILTQE